LQNLKLFSDKRFYGFKIGVPVITNEKPIAGIPSLASTAALIVPE
jgi:hypothetical protein